jgi:hypothetical protein
MLYYRKTKLQAKKFYNIVQSCHLSLIWLLSASEHSTRRLVQIWLSIRKTLYELVTIIFWVRLLYHLSNHSILYWLLKVNTPSLKE